MKKLKNIHKPTDERKLIFQNVEKDRVRTCRKLQGLAMENSKIDEMDELLRQQAELSQIINKKLSEKRSADLDLIKKLCIMHKFTIKDFQDKLTSARYSEEAINIPVDQKKSTKVSKWLSN